MDQEQMKGTEESKLIEEIANLRGIVMEIKHHVFEPTPLTGEGLNSVNPRSEHKLSNLKDEIRAIKRDLEEILKAVSLI